MKKEIAEKVIKILLTADGGCEYCVADLLKLFCNEFPEYTGSAKDAFEKSFGKKLLLKDEKETNQSKVKQDKKEESYNLHGWDDEKVYFWDKQKGKEYCVTDEKHLYEHLVDICIEYFKKKGKEK